MLYVEIRTRGHIDGHWSSWFEDLAIEHGPGGETTLTGTVVDQSALYGLLARLRDLGLPLLSVYSAEVDPGPRQGQAGPEEGEAGPG
ncbi:MAG: hypothetical protein JXA09_17340 [Anaerolineae bacterium]|nr:hypothetical protein [Anaerolineae bacterium]